MVESKVLRGHAFNISLDKSKILKGWYLFVTESNQEYLVRRNWSLTSRRSYSFYQTDFSLADYKLSEQADSKNKNSYLVLALVIASLLRVLTPLDWWFGPTNYPVDIIDGGINLAILLVIFFLAALIVSWSRVQVLRFFLKKEGAVLQYKGKIKSQTPLSFSQRGIGFW